jgi:serine/threonine protein kinase
MIMSNTDSPTQLGRYRIVSELGRGAMGVVYEAEDPSLNRTVAIKTIFMATDPAERAEYVARFHQEAKAAGGLNHPNIITIYDIGREGDLAYMAMELIEGAELRATLSAQRLSVAEVLDIAHQVAQGLAFAHARGVVHRDIKPANIMLVRGQHAKIMDFGIARLQVSDVKTQTGTVLGSPKYMSPEQIVGRPVDHRSDIFSLGVVLYEMVAGTPPFSGADVNQLMFAICNGEHAQASRVNPAAPAMLDLILGKALAKSSTERYQSAHEMATDLLACRAELAQQHPEAPAMGGATMRLNADPDWATTKATTLAFAETQALEAGSTVRLGGGNAYHRTDTSPRFTLSRRFDSTGGAETLE